MISMLLQESVFSLLMAPTDLHWFSHLCRKNGAFVEASHRGDSGLPQEFSCPPRDPLSAAGHRHFLQTASRCVLTAGRAPQGSVAACSCQNV